MRTTNDRTSVRAFQVIEALPMPFQDLFIYTPKENVTSEGGVTHVLNQVALHIGLRPGDDAKKTMDQIWQSNQRLKGE